jgi:pimeloyl-ACP methyl ester carboxylesterase
MSTTEVEEYFSPSQAPVVRDTLIANHTINYAYQDNHQAITIVFLHGAPGSWSAFADFMKMDSLREVANILSVDRPGYGYSDFGKPMISLKGQSYLISDVLRNYKDHKLLLVGHSLGASVAARIAMDFPELVQGLVLVGPSIDPNLEKDEWFRVLARNKLGKWLLPKSLFVTNEEIFFLKEELQKMLPHWQKINVPVTIVQGVEDELVPKENAEFARRMIHPRYIDVRYFEKVNHFIPWNNPELIVNAVVDQINNAEDY